MIYGRWSDYEEIRKDFFQGEFDYTTRTYKDVTVPDDFPKEEELLFASYGGGSYDGDAVLIWMRDGQLYEAHGSHCSCYGLEGQFEPEETSVSALGCRSKPGDNRYYYFMHDHDIDAVEGYWELVKNLSEGR